MALIFFSRLCAVLTMLLGFIAFIPHHIIPQLFVGGRLFGLFEIDLAMRIFYIATALGGMRAARFGASHAKQFLQIAAMVYGIISALGFIQNGKPIAEMISTTYYNNCLHAGLAFLMALGGFILKEPRAPSRRKWGDFNDSVGGYSK